MSAHGELTLVLHLTDEDSLYTLAREGLPPEMMPSESLRAIYEFATDYYIKSGSTQAPSATVLHETFENTLEDAEIDLREDAPDDTIEWAIDDLKSGWAYSNTNDFNKQLAYAITEAEAGDRVRVVGEAATALVELSGALQRKSVHVEAKEGLDDAMSRYEVRANDPGTVRGMSTGLREVDEHIAGVWDGELLINSAYAKVGKSYLMLHSARAEWARGRNVLIYSLELSTQEVFDRIACMEAGVDGGRWQKGQCTDREVEMVMDRISELHKRDAQLVVKMPEIGRRSVPIMVREAQVWDAASLYIDQLTFVELSGSGNAMHERIGETLHDLKAGISTARTPIPCFLNHQINREGHQASLKSGRIESYHLANASECERTADWVTGLFRGHDQQVLNRAQFQMVMARRAPLKWWELEWVPDRGNIRVSRELQIEEA